MAGSFGGERFLQVRLPSYTQEHVVLSLLLAVAFILWIFVIPVLLSSESSVSSASETAAPTSNGKARNRKSHNGKAKAAASSADKPADKAVVREIPLGVSVLTTAGFIFSCLVLILGWNPSNYYTPRRMFQVPLLTADECQQVMDMASAAADRYYQQAKLEADGDDATAHKNPLLDEPLGWQKSRHSVYPTTDLNLVTDPFTQLDREWLQGLLDRRLAPVISRIYGIPAASIRANDLFVVRYDADHQTFLSKHTDDNDISINILLNDNFIGGGTRLFHRNAEPFGHAKPSPGECLINSALIQHEGYPIQFGTRWILVGFLSVDRVDPASRRHSGIGFFASWLSLPWLHVKIKEGYFSANHRLHRTQGVSDKLTDSHYSRLLMVELVHWLEWIGDVFATHELEKLVDDSHAAEYLAALDEAYEASNDSNRASWFAGQNLNLNVDGTIESEWTTRAENSDRVQEL